MTSRNDQLDLLCSQVSDHYVFPDVANEIVAVLRGRIAEGSYTGLDDDAAFAEAVTRDLQSVNGDKHLRLLHSVEVVPEHDAFDLEAYREQAGLCAYGFARVELLAGNVGLLDIRSLYDAGLAGERATAAMTLVAGADALIIDLRRNGGGSPNMIALLCSYLFDEPTHLNSLYWRASDTTEQYWTLPYVPGARYGGEKPVYVLTSAYTFSGAEELSYNLQSRSRATIVGETTRGGAHPGTRYYIGPHLKSAVPSGRAVNPVTGTNWEGAGVQPDLKVAADDALDVAYGLALQHVLTLGEEGARRPVADAAREALQELG
ncbi:MAG: S41 family peptidase [Thermoactinospora sp.]|nr:S41 family peptidase [Thermoactinospora sp.]